jgi:signal transduction histidine kinase
MSTQPYKFKVSSALKTIIGKELITSDFIAVFELVKNSFDAHAKSVTIRFEGIKGENPKLIIQDNGKGMTETDLKDKWLFVAYSAKKDGSEDENLADRDDYRDKIMSGRPFAGAKGIGRFSCDRLGQLLSLYTKANLKQKTFEKLEIDWSDFERNAHTRFETISVKHSAPRTIPYTIPTHGTVLEICQLRDDWGRDKLLKLKESLRKLINPGQGRNERSFRVLLEVPEERASDKEEEDELRKVNGEIRNFIFEELGLKTTEIQCTVDKLGKTITTSLTDRGTLIYKLTEENPFSDLKDVHISLFALNRSAKMHFKKIMGVDHVSYGSVFLYKNGFRVHPIGDEGDDGLGLDRRKQQGAFRYLGTRDLAGRIEINADNNSFKEVSSRDGGLIESTEYNQLLELFWDYGLKRLERYVIDVIKWGNTPEGLEDTALQPKDVKAQILELVAKLTSATGVRDVEYDPDVLDIVSKRQSQSAVVALANFKRIAEQQENPQLKREVERTERQIKSLLKAKDSAETEIKSERIARKQTERNLETERRKNLFLLASAGTPEAHRESLEHWIKIVAGHIKTAIFQLMREVRDGHFDREGMLSQLEKIHRWSQQMEKASRIVTNANFNLEANKIRNDLARFIFEYLTSEDLKKSKLNVAVEFDHKSHVALFRPIEIMIVFDNLIDNAIKAGARNIEVSIKTERARLIIVVANDGEVVPETVAASMFELGISGRRGSGIGLHACREIISGLGGEIQFVGNHEKLGGAVFKMEFQS